MTITIESKNIDLINSLFLLLKGNKELTVQVNEDNTVSEGLDFNKFDAETQRIIKSSIDDYRNGRKDRFISFEKVFPDAVQA